MPRRLMLTSLWCSECNEDKSDIPINTTSLEWLFTNTSVLLWVDKLLITSQDFEDLHLQPYFNNLVTQECARMLFDRLHDEGIIEVFDPKKYLNKLTLESIDKQAFLDQERWGKEPEQPDIDGLKDHLTINIEGNYYCQPRTA